MNRSAAWLHQALEKACKALLPDIGQQAWGHGLGRSFRDLSLQVEQPLAAAASNLEDRRRIFDAVYIPTRCPDHLHEGAPTDHSGRLQRCWNELAKP